MSNANKIGAYHLLQLAEQGRPVETVAQFLASMWVSGDLTPYYIYNDVKKIAERTTFLMSPRGQCEIWPGLTPGGWRDEDMWQPEAEAEKERLLEILDNIQVELNNAKPVPF
jgi:hypothetical protein